MVVKLITPRLKYSDIHKDLAANPITGDLALRRDEESVKESIKNIILTDQGERLMQPLIGGNIRAMLFENNTPAVMKMIQEQIRTTIETYEPRCSLIDINVLSLADETSIKIDIYFYINNIAEPIALTVFLERTR